jgi:ParB family chromosome partitioning protein
MKTESMLGSRGQVSEIDMDLIYYEGDRKYGGEGDIQSLSMSMTIVGLIQAIVVYPEADGRYRIIAGRRRFEAAKLLDWKTIEAKIWLKGEDSEEISLIENVNREEMNPLDEAALFQKQLADGRDINELAQYYNRSVSAIYQRIKLTKLIDNLKEFYRAGRATITAVAMLAALDEKLQEKFYKKYSDWNEIGIRTAEEFLHSVQHNTLTCIVDKKCAECTKRTFHSDKNLFPEYDGLEDICFDDTCYTKKWIALLARELKKGKSNYPDTQNILVMNNLPRIFKDSTLMVDKVEYQIKRYGWENTAIKEDEGAFFAWEVSISYRSNKIQLQQRCYKEIVKKVVDPKLESKFETGSVVNGIVEENLKSKFGGEDAGEPVGDLVKAQEIEKIDTKLKKKFSSRYSLTQKIRFELMKQFAGNLKNKCPDFTRELITQEIDGTDDQDTELYKIITGLDYAKGLPGIEAVEPLKNIALLFVLQIEDYNWPDIDDNDDEDEDGLKDEDDDEEELKVYQLSGLNRVQFRELYRKTAREIIDAALASPDKPDQEDTGMEDKDKEE